MLPIHSIRQQILDSLSRSNRLVLTAPTGSGKTTQVPQFLLESGWGSRERQVIVLQPRRLAARLVAQRVAAELKAPLGGVVGFQTRHESRVSGQTVIRFMTEGLFLRQVQSNPRLDGVGFVILDEFHERNLATDASLALVKLLQENSREDLRMIVMSATLDTARVSEYLACPVLEAHGRVFPVDVRYLAKRPVAPARMSHLPQARRGIPVWELAADALREIVETGGEGDVLIFMPGGYEIRRTIEQCQPLRSTESLSIFPLHSELTADQQDEALSPAANRKVIVSTNVAETSITIAGIRHVIDGGLARINRFDARRGINVLRVEPISQASAEQRAGRAGRTAPGTCHRLWLESEHRHRPAHTAPEIQRLDLAEVVLQLLSMGIRDVAGFPWLEAPSETSLRQAIETLIELDAVRYSGSGFRGPGSADQRDAEAGTRNALLTPLGGTMARLPMHPRLSRMLVEAGSRSCLGRAALWAALISERDILIPRVKHPFADDVPTEFPSADFLALEAAMDFARSVHLDADRCGSKGVNANACREVDRTRKLYLDAARAAGLAERNVPKPAGRTRQAPSPQPSPRSAGAREEANSLVELAKCLLVAFPDHLAMRRSESNFACDLTAGRRGQLDPDSVAKHVGLILPLERVELNAPGAKAAQGSAGAGQTMRTVLSLATEIHPDWLVEMHGERIRHERQTIYNEQAQAAETVEREVFEGLIIEEKLAAQTDRAAAAEVLAERVVDGTLKLEKWDCAVEQWIERTRCVARWFPERRLISYAPDDLRVIIQEICTGATRYREIRDKPCLQNLKDALSWEDRRLVEQMAPERIELARGFRMKIEYSAGSPPRGRARIQDFYGMTQTPTVGGGRAKILLEILAPSNRPVQVTDDLANFWENLYPTLKKELSRRYPRHEWR